MERGNTDQERHEHDPDAMEELGRLPRIPERGMDGQESLQQSLRR